MNVISSAPNDQPVQFRKPSNKSESRRLEIDIHTLTMQNIRLSN